MQWECCSGRRQWMCERVDAGRVSRGIETIRMLLPISFTGFLDITFPEYFDDLDNRVANNSRQLAIIPCCALCCISIDSAFLNNNVCVLPPPCCPLRLSAKITTFSRRLTSVGRTTSGTRTACLATVRPSSRLTYGLTMMLCSPGSNSTRPDRF